MTNIPVPSPLDLKLVDILAEYPSVETDEGTLVGPTVYTMIVENDGVHKRVVTDVETYRQIRNVALGVY